MFWQELLAAIWTVLIAPFQDLSVLWQLIPIFLMWILLEAYFVRWNESLGWNSALANAVTLFWISITSLEVLFNRGFEFGLFFLFVFAIVYALFISYVVFKHTMREKLAFLIASPVFIHFFNIMLVLWAHKLMPFTLMIVLAVIVLFGVFILADYLLKFFLREEQKVEHRIQDQFQHFADTRPHSPPQRNFTKPTHSFSAPQKTQQRVPRRVENGSQNRTTRYRKK